MMIEGVGAGGSVASYLKFIFYVFSIAHVIFFSMEKIGPGSSVILINHNYREMTVDTSGTNFFAMSCSFFLSPCFI